jgi:hypothetical protein
MLVFTDAVLSDIGEHIAKYDPERGGALLGLPYTNVVCRFIADPQAYTSSVVYQPSATLQKIVHEQEIAHGLQFFGIVHSHPGSFSQPSSQDHVAFLNSLNVNPHLSAFVAPIITLDRGASPDRPNEVPLSPRGRLTSYVAYRPRRAPEVEVAGWTVSRQSDWRDPAPRRSTSDHNVTVVPTACSIMPVRKHVESVVDGLKERSISVQQKNGFLSIAGSLFQTETLRGDSFEVILLFSPTYPVSRPVLLFTATGGDGLGDTQELDFKWPFGAVNNQVLWPLVAGCIMDAVGSLGRTPPKIPDVVDMAAATGAYRRGVGNDSGPQSPPDLGPAKSGFGGGDA